MVSGLRIRKRNGRNENTICRTSSGSKYVYAIRTHAIFFNEVHFDYFKLYFFCYAAAADCPNITERYSKSIDKLKTMVDLKPRVIEDVISIRDKFACNDKAIKFIENFVSNCVYRFLTSQSTNS